LAVQSQVRGRWCRSPVPPAQHDKSAALTPAVLEGGDCGLEGVACGEGYDGGASETGLPSRRAGLGHVERPPVLVDRRPVDRSARSAPPVVARLREAGPGRTSTGHRVTVVGTRACRP
jgi:hypothetical protein